jgi:hypothetical protein
MMTDVMSMVIGVIVVIVVVVVVKFLGCVPGNAWFCAHLLQCLNYINVSIP